MKGRPENDAERMAEPVGQDSDDAADCGSDGDDLLLAFALGPDAALLRDPCDLSVAQASG